MALTPLNKHTYVFRGEPVSSANLNEIQDCIVEMQTEYTDPADVGDVADLETTATDIVGAINEVLGDVGEVDDRVTALDAKADTINGTFRMLTALPARTKSVSSASTTMLCTDVPQLSPQQKPGILITGQLPL